MTWTVADLSAGVVRANAAMSGLEQILNDADAKLGDGDTGGMLVRLISRMTEVELSHTSDVGTAFTLLAKAAITATGSSLGTLVATGLMTVAKAKKGQKSIETDELAGLLLQCRDAMIARGGAELGDKTVLDSLEAVITALNSNAGPRVSETVNVAAHQALQDFRERPNKRGRARMFGDATIGLDDPGMLAFARLTAAITC